MTNFQRFIDLIEIAEVHKVLLDIKEKYISCSYVDDQDTVVGKVKMRGNPFQISDVSVAISQLPILKRILSNFENPSLKLEYNEYNLNDREPKSIIIEEDNIKSQFILSYTNKIKTVKGIDNIDQDPIIELDITEEIKDKIYKLSNALSSQNNYFMFKSIENNLYMIFGEFSEGRYVAYNNISYNFNIEVSTNFTLKFDTKSMNKILIKNKEFKTSFILYDELLQISNISDDFKTKYFLKKIHDNT